MPSLERSIIAESFNPAHSIVRPAGPISPFVFSSPHSGRTYPSAFLDAAQISPATLRKSEDSFVDQLFAGAPGYGAPLLAAHFPRAYLDVNREPYELDPLLFDDPLPSFANTKSMRVMAGLGTVARIVADSEHIYRDKLSIEDALTRIELLYVPYHKALKTLVAGAVEQFGFAVLVDCHSMPSTGIWPSNDSRPDVVLGDRFGCSCDRRLTRLMELILVEQGYNVALNRPYAGGFITEHYGQPLLGVHTIQIEFNRALYMNERTFTPTQGLARTQSAINTFIHQFVAQTPSLLGPATATAAE